MFFPGYFNWAFEQGSYAPVLLSFKNPDGSPMDLSFFGARAKLVHNRGDEDAIFDLTVGDGLTIDELAGTILMEIPATTSLAAGEEVVAGAYDLMLDPSGSPGPGSYAALIGNWTMLIAATR